LQQRSIAASEGGLTAVVEHEPDAVVLAVRGEIDLASAARLGAYVDGILACATGTVVLDLAGVTFMDSTGLAVILRAAKELAGRGSDLVLRAPTPTVLRVLTVTGVARYLSVTA
jgi:anti-sigma B factor antagonist